MPKVIDLPTSSSMNNNDYFVMESNGGGTKKITKSNAVNLSNLGGRNILPSISIAAGTSRTVQIGSNVSWTAFLVLGTVSGYGPAALICWISNGGISLILDLKTNTQWNAAGLGITASGGDITFTNGGSNATTITVYAG